MNNSDYSNNRSGFAAEQLNMSIDNPNCRYGPAKPASDDSGFLLCEGDNKLLFFKLRNTEFMGNMCDKYPNAFRLLNLIIRRIKTNDEYSDLKWGQCKIGRDEASLKLSITPSQYKSSINYLINHQQITTKSSNKGTIVTIGKSCIYDISKPVDSQSINNKNSVDSQLPTPNLDIDKEIDKDFKNKTKAKTKSSTPKNQEYSTECSFVVKEIINHVQSKKNVNVSPSKKAQWHEHIDKLQRIDGVSWERMAKVLEFMDKSESPYVPVIESTKAFREKFTRLEDAIKREQYDNSPEVPRTIGIASDNSKSFRVVNDD